MRKIKVTAFEAKDGKVFSNEYDCQKWEEHLFLDRLHRLLYSTHFLFRFRIKPYFHNRMVSRLTNRETTPPLWFDEKYPDDNNSYILVGGRQGNGDCRVQYKKRGNKVVLLRYNTDTFLEKKYICTIPKEWLTMDKRELQAAVNQYFIDKYAKYRVRFHNEGSTSYWLANWSGGDPARTTNKESARVFNTRKGAKGYRTRVINENQHRYRGLDVDEISVIEEFIPPQKGV